MNVRTHMLVPLAVAAGIALPSLSYANHARSYPGYGEVGFKDHATSTRSDKTREEVNADIAAGRKDGTMWLSLRGVPAPVKSTAPAKTRQEVADELKDESVSVRYARMLGVFK